MLSALARSRLAVVLVGARNPQNIGAAARAMQDFGFGDLRVVNAFAPPFEAAQLEAKSAVGAADVMRSAQLFSSLVEAIADCSTVVGTTAIGERSLARPVLSLQEAAPILKSGLERSSEGTEPTLDLRSPEQASRSAAPRVALLFGSEKTGLTNEHLSFCTHCLTVPMFAPEGRHLSMNLGQSVAVCLYELTRDGLEGARAWETRNDPEATVSHRERLLELVQETMARSGYARRFPASARTEIVRALVSQLGHSRSEVSTWMGFFRAVLRGLSGEAHPLPIRTEAGE